jgi:type II secretory pathway component PulF
MTYSSSTSDLENGLGIALGLRTCAEEIGAGADRRQFLRLARRLEDGQPLDSQVDKGSPRSRGFATLIRTGAQSGRLGHVLEEYCRSTREIRGLWRSLFISLLYPVAILFTGAVVFSLFLMLTMPRMRDMFSDFGIELPWFTVVVIQLGQLLWTIWPVLVFLFALWPILLLFGPVLPGRKSRQRLFRILPLIGSISRNAAAAEYCSRLSVLVEAKLPLPDAMRLVGISLRDQVLGGVCDRIARRLDEGIPPHEFARGVAGMPPALAGSFRWADDGDVFASGLRSLGEVFAVQARIRADQFGFLVAPFAFAAVGGLGGLVVLSYFTPLVKLLNDLS